MIFLVCLRRDRKSVDIEFIFGEKNKKLLFPPMVCCCC